MSTMRKTVSPIILALDTNDLDIASQWINATTDSVNIFKVGLEFYLKFGAVGLQTLRDARDFELFLDLKLHDIPNTVAGAVISVAHLDPKFLTVHASGGSKMIKSAVEQAPHISITAVTVLTSLDDDALLELGIKENPLNLACSFATVAVNAGARAIVCSPMEVQAIRSVVGDSIEIITPGVRPFGSPQGDQNRTLSPAEAIEAGANYVVIGRPITSYFEKSAQAMSERAAEILESLHL